MCEVTRNHSLWDQSSLINRRSRSAAGRCWPCPALSLGVRRDDTALSILYPARPEPMPPPRASPADRRSAQNRLAFQRLHHATPGQRDYQPHGALSWVDALPTHSFACPLRRFPRWYPLTANPARCLQRDFQPKHGPGVESRPRYRLSTRHRAVPIGYRPGSPRLRSPRPRPPLPS